LEDIEIKSKIEKDIKRVIFTDIDGCLCLEDSDYFYFDSDCLARLQHITEITDSYIVISSAWRVGQSIQSLRDIFSIQGDTYGIYKGPRPYFDVSRIIGKTLSLHIGRQDETSVLWGRGYEIDSWLKDTKDKLSIEKFLIIDDEIADLKTFKANTLKTNCKTGITEEIAQEAIRRLS
jgi:HAD domain in Swiss Army Knife RNA repair proteins